MHPQAEHLAARRSRTYRPRLTLLEDRCLLSVTLSESGPAVPLVGSPVTWTATASDHGETPVYQFRVGRAGGESQVVRDFSPGNSFTWNSLQEGSYVIQVTVKDSFNDASGESASASYTANSRVNGPGAVISPTSNPLVALYSAPPSSSGVSMHVEFKPLGSTQTWRSTASLPVVPGQSTNFLVAGMRADTTYLMRHVLDNGTTSASLTFRTGSLPTNLNLPTFSVVQPPSPGTDLTQDMVLNMGIDLTGTAVSTVATDLSGNIVWYYDSVTNPFPGYATSLVPGGTVLMMGGKLSGPGGTTTLREIDLAGDILRETNIDAVNAELAAMGQHPIGDFNHEARRLPNGDTAVLARAPRTIDVNGTPTDYNGDMVLILDQNFQVVWAWDPFDWLDTNRLPPLGEGPGDWMHANAIAWSPADGNLIVSLRAQDWVIKIDYANGTGDGHVIWRLGQGGDFTMNSTDPYPWFTHQHDAHYINDSTIVVFDDGNTRRNSDPNANSRGQELVLDETTMQASLVLNADLGNYSPALGSAERLPNGNFSFDSGWDAKQTIEVLPDGTRSYILQMNSSDVLYRSYMEHTLYGDSPYVEKADLTVYRPSSGQWISSTAGGPGFNERPQWGLPGDIAVPADFNGDGQSDLAVFRPSSGRWYINANGQALVNGLQWGLPGDVPFTGDFNGDGKADLAVFRPSNSQWYIATTDGQVLLNGEQWGLPGDVPVTGDFDRDGRTDLAVFRPSNGSWYVRTLAGSVPVYGQQWGLPGDIPVPGDYNGDGQTDLAVFRPSNNCWYVVSIGGPILTFGQPWGQSGDTPATGDFNGDGKLDLAVFRPASGRWFVQSLDGQVIVDGAQGGIRGDTPSIGDFNGDGRSDLAVFHPNDGTWSIRPMGGTVLTNSEQWGQRGDIPVPADYIEEGRNQLAVFRPSNGRWFITAANGPVIAPGQQWGLPGDIPLAGDFNGDGKADLAVFRPSSGQWYIETLDGQVIVNGDQWGLPGDIPEVGDFNGDGQADLAVFRPSNGLWYITTVNGTVITYGQSWGLPGDIPVPGDFNGDGQTDLAVFRPSNSQWYITSLGGPVLAYGLPWGQKDDIPSTADFNGDDQTDLAVFRPANGAWYVMSLGGHVITYDQQAGQQGDIPTTATAFQRAQQVYGLRASSVPDPSQLNTASIEQSSGTPSSATPGPGSLRRFVSQQRRRHLRSVLAGRH